RNRKSVFGDFCPYLADFLYLRGAVLSVLERFGAFLSFSGLPAALKNAQKCSKVLQMSQILPRNPQRRRNRKSVFGDICPYLADFLYLRGAVLSVLERFGAFLSFSGLPAALKSAQKCSKVLQMSQILPRNPQRRRNRKSVFGDFCPYLADFLYLRGAVLGVLERFGAFLSFSGFTAALKSAQECSRVLQLSQIL
ncbi:MAG: hypothetical protein GY735_23740, partial [Delftia sp.]|nr:hypothetical protein [Delftia sp.]